MSAKPQAGALNTDIDQLLTKWGVHIDPELLVLALTHRSFANEQGGLPNNERLEFLGDSVLSIVATEALYHEHADVAESELAKMRSSVVSQRPLARVARTLDLGSYILLGVGENKTGGRDKDSILSDTLEALIGATYLSNGIEETKRVLLSHLRIPLDEADALSSTMDWKSPLREYASGNDLGEVRFEVEGTGPDHDRHFYADVYVGSTVLGKGDGPSRKQAENQAAKSGYLLLTGQESK